MSTGAVFCAPYVPRGPRIIVNPNLAGDPDNPQGPGYPRVCREMPNNRHEITGACEKLMWEYILSDDVDVEVIDGEGQVDQWMGGLLFERMKRERELTRLLLNGEQNGEPGASRLATLVLGLRVLELDRLHGPGATLAYILMYMTARELRMIIEGYNDPLGPSSVSLLATTIDYLRERFETLTGMQINEVSATFAHQPMASCADTRCTVIAFLFFIQANDTRIRPEFPLPS